MPTIYNKVKFGNDTLIDLTADTIAPENSLATASFHDASGATATGSIENTSADKTTLDCDESAHIPAGYTGSSITVTANTLASQTPANATASDIIVDKTAWVNGVKVIGSMPSNGATGGTISTKSGSVIVPAGYTSGGTVSIAADQQALLIPDNIAKDAVVLGVTGTHEGGVDISDTTAIPASVMKPKKFHGADGTLYTGVRDYPGTITMTAPSTAGDVYTLSNMVDASSETLTKGAVDANNNVYFNISGLTANMDPAEVPYGKKWIDSAGYVKTGTKTESGLGYGFAFSPVYRSRPSGAEYWGISYFNGSISSWSNVANKTNTSWYGAPTSSCIWLSCTTANPIYITDLFFNVRPGSSTSNQYILLCDLEYGRSGTATSDYIMITDFTWYPVNTGSDKHLEVHLDTPKYHHLHYTELRPYQKAIAFMIGTPLNTEPTHDLDDWNINYFSSVCNFCFDGFYA